MGYFCGLIKLNINRFVYRTFSFHVCVIIIVIIHCSAYFAFKQQLYSQFSSRPSLPSYARGVSMKNKSKATRKLLVECISNRITVISNFDQNYQVNI